MKTPEQQKRDENWSLLSGQVVGGEAFPVVDSRKEIAQLRQQLAERTAELAEAKLPKLSEVQDIYEINKLKAELGQLRQQLAERTAEVDELQDAVRGEAVLKAQQLAKLEHELDAVKRELAKWETGCRVNAENCKEALRVQDNQRLDILVLKAEFDALKRERDKLRQELRKLVLFAECLWMNVPYESRKDLNCRDLESARDTLKP